MGLRPDLIVMEIGYDDDVDLPLREAIEACTGEELLDEEADEVVDVVLLWFRDGDDDLADTLVDAIGPLADDGSIWLLTPKRGNEYYVEPADISEAASIAGLSQTSVMPLGDDWSGTRLVGRKSGSGGRK
jgi:hypothetical protein